MTPALIATYQALLACYRSGQMSERSWSEHLKDEAFAAYVRRQGRGEA